MKQVQPDGIILYNNFKKEESEVDYLIAEQHFFGNNNTQKKPEKIPALTGFNLFISVGSVYKHFP
ncbi:MAG: hypothetical protein WKG06_34665 [Segetibacter sp.]